MPDDEKQGSQTSTLGRLADKGEEAVTKLIDELAKNPRVTDALARVMEAKGKADQATRKTLANSSGAAATQIKDLRLRLERLEQRLQNMESSEAATATKPAASKPATPKKPAAAAKPVVKAAAKPAAAKKPAAARKPAAQKPPAKPKPPA